MWLNTLLLALRSIRRNLMRSFLTILGIVIGVSAVITMVTLGNGATLAIQNQISGLGTNLLQVRPGQRMGPGSGGAPAFKDVDADAIAQQIGGVLAVAPEGRTGATVVAVRLPLLLVLRLALLLLPLRTRNTCPTSICEASRRLFQRASVFTLWPKRRPMR